MASEILGGIAREHQSARRGAQHRQQLLQGRAATRFLSAFHDHERAAVGAGALGSFARGKRGILAGRKTLGQRVPDLLRLGLEPVEVQEHQAVRERTAGQVFVLLADGHANGVGGKRSFAKAGEAEDAGVLAPAEPGGEFVPLRVAADKCTRADGREAVKRDLPRGWAGERSRLNSANHRPRRTRHQDAIVQQLARSAANLRIQLARLGDGEMVFVETHRVGAHAGMGGGGVDDRHALQSAQLVVGDGSNVLLLCLPAIPVVQVAQVSVMRPQVFDAEGGPENRAEGVTQ